MAAGDLDDRVVYDFVAGLAQATLQTPAPAFVRNGEFTIDGVRQRVLLSHPESQILYDLELDQETTLAFEVAMDPASWTEAGDGVTFFVAVKPGPDGSGRAADKTASDAEPVHLWSTTINPKQNWADRRWHAFTVDLSAYSGRAVTLVFQTGPGPAGDDRYDWAGWGAPRLLRTGLDSDF